MSADAVQLRAAVLLRPEVCIPVGAVPEDERDVGQRLDVVDRRRAAVETHGRGKRRLVAGLRALALERLEERRLFTGFVRARAPMNVDVAVESGSEDVPAEESAGVGL